MRCILHIDMNKFYASVEQLLNPALRNKPIAVCGSESERHGIVLTASAEAKAMGVKTGMANWEARRCCPGLIVVPPQYEQYLRFSRLARDIYLRWTDLVEPYGMDECWADISVICRDWAEAEQTAHDIRLAVRGELGLTVSVGVSFNKVFAKLGSDMKKPDAVTLLSAENWREKVWPLPVWDLLFVGRHTKKKLEGRGIYTIGELAMADKDMMRCFLGKNGTMLWRYANGLDASPVVPVSAAPEVESVGHGITCRCNLVNDEEVRLVLLQLSQDIGRRLRKHSLSARGVRLGVRRADLSPAPTRQPQLGYATQSPEELGAAAFVLFKTYDWLQPVRALSVTAIELVPQDSPEQLDFFGDARRHQRRKALDDCIVRVRSRFGEDALKAASLMGDLHMPRDGRELVQMPGTLGAMR